MEITKILPDVLTFKPKLYENPSINWLSWDIQSIIMINREDVILCMQTKCAVS